MEDRGRCWGNLSKSAQRCVRNYMKTRDGAFPRLGEKRKCSSVRHDDPSNVSTLLQQFKASSLDIWRTGKRGLPAAGSGLLNAKSETDFSGSIGRVRVIFAEIRLAVEVEAVNGI